MPLLFGVAVAVTGFMVLCLLFFQATRKTYPGFDYWTAGVGFFVLGYLLYALRGQIPLWVTVFLGNWAFSLGMVLHLDGIRRFLGLKPASRLWYALPLAVLAGLGLFYFRWDSPTWRGLVVAIALSSVHWTMAALIFRKAIQPRSAFYKAIAWFLSFAGLLILVRALWLVSAPNSDFLFKAPLEFFFFTAFIVLHLGENISLIMLNAERVESELLETKDDLIQTVRNLREALISQKETEESLRVSEDRYRGFFQTCRDAVFMTGLDGQFLDFNDVALEVFGYGLEDRSKLLQVNVASVYADPGEREEHAALVARQGFSKEYPLDLKRTDGTIIHTLVTTVVRKDPQENIIGFQGTVRDISESKRASEALAKSRSELHAIYESSPIMMCVVDAQRKVLYANRALTEFVRKSENQLMDGSACGIFGCINASDDPRGCGYGPKCPFCTLRMAMDDTSKTGATHRGIEYRSTLVIEGRHREVLLHGSTARIQSDDQSRVLLCLEDVTDRKKAEEEREILRKELFQAQKMEAIGTLTGGIAHDFNNMLQIINGYTEMILADIKEGDPIYSDLQKILDTGRKGADLVQRLLALSKKGESDLRPLDLNCIVENSVSVMERTFPKMVEWETVFGRDLSLVNADSAQLEQILLNLCINSKEAMPHGGKLKIETKNVVVDKAECILQLNAKPGPHVLIEVTDTGTGMDENTLDRLFDPFFTTKGWDSRKGTGLGLSVARGMVEEHGGWITCESKRGEGTTFRIYLPAIDNSSAIEAPVKGVVRGPGSGRILLVDDEEHIRELGKLILERVGYSVITASNGKEALEIYRGEPSSIDLVVLDLIMPQMSGLECLEELFKIDRNVKVVVSSGHAPDAQEKLLLGAMAKGFVNKPYEVKQLLQVVADLS